jgi:predicted pyridoxine 5'-phosphate oxidase superfamily flavin-nucleotide-binding protein
MRETPEDLRRLQEVLDRSRAQMRSSMLAHVFTDERALTAEALVALFPDRRVAAFATVSADGRPRVAPVDVLFVRGRFHLATPNTSLRVRHLRRQPAASLTYFDGDDTGVIAHGPARILAPGDPEFTDADAACREIYGQSALDWSADSIYVWLEPELLFGFAA